MCETTLCEKLRQIQIENAVEIERLQMENHKLQTECGHLRADVKELQDANRIHMHAAVIRLPEVVPDKNT